MLLRFLALGAPVGFALALALAPAPQARAQTIALDGHLPRDLSTGVALKVTIAGVSAALHARGAADGQDEAQQFPNRMQVFFPNRSLGSPLHYDLASAIADAAMPLYVTAPTPHAETLQADGSWTYTYDIQIAEALPGALATTICGLPDCTDPQLPVVVEFFLGTGTSGDPVAVLDPPVVLTQREF